MPGLPHRIVSFSIKLSLCEGAGAQPRPCPEGFYCPGGPSQTCPAGYYSGTRTGLKSIDECQLCPAGFYCPEGSKEAMPVPEVFYIKSLGNV